MPRRLALALAVVLLASLAYRGSPAKADRSIESGFWNYAGAPIRIEDCTAKIVDSPFGNVDFYVHPWVMSTNVTRKTIIAVKFQFWTFNSFDERLDSQEVLSDRRLAPGDAYEAEFEFLNLFNTTKSVTCVPSAVRFSDGTFWTNDFKHPLKDAPQPKPAATKKTPPPKATPKAKPTPRPTPKPKPTPASTAAPSEHPPACRVKLADNSEIEIPWDNPGCANARKAFAAKNHPATCTVRLADGRTIEIPWDNPGCADARAAWANGGEAQGGSSGAAASPTTFVSYDRADNSVQGHPAACIVVENGVTRRPPWQSESCGPARAKWALEPGYMHEMLWDSHDAAPENLVNGHPRYCTPRENKSDHYFWSSVPCKNARLKWEAIQNNTPAPPS